MPRRATDKPILWLVRQPHGLVPASQYDAEELERYAIGTRITATVEQPKNGDLMRFWFALIGKVAKGLGLSPESLRFRLMVRAGCCDRVVELGDQMMVVPRSVASLDQGEFSDLVDRTVEIVTTELLPGVDAKELLDETYDYAAISTQVEP